MRFLRTCAQYVSMNEFACSEHFVRIRRSKERSTGNQTIFRNVCKFVNCNTSTSFILCVTRSVMFLTRSDNNIICKRTV